MSALECQSDKSALESQSHMLALKSQGESDMSALVSRMTINKVSTVTWGKGGGIQRAQRTLQVAEGHQPSARARSRNL